MSNVATALPAAANNNQTTQIATGGDDSLLAQGSLKSRGNPMVSWFRGAIGALAIAGAAQPSSEAATVGVAWDKYTDAPTNTTIKVAAGTAANRPNLGFRVTPATLNGLTFTGLPNGKGIFFAAQAYRTANPGSMSAWTAWLYIVTPTTTSGIKKTSLEPAPANSPLPVVATFAYSAPTKTVFNVTDINGSKVPNSIPSTEPVQTFSSAPSATATTGIQDFDLTSLALNQAIANIRSAFMDLPPQALVDLTPQEPVDNSPRYMASSEELPQMTTPPNYADLASLGFSPPSDSITFANAGFPSQRLIRNPSALDQKVRIVNFERPSAHIASLSIHFPESTVGQQFAVEACTDLTNGNWVSAGGGVILTSDLLMQVPVAEEGQNPNMMIFRIRVGKLPLEGNAAVLK